MIQKIKQVCQGGAFIASIIALPYLIQWEGVENHAYRDVVGVITICSGETRGVKAGDYKTDEECEKMTGESALEFAEYVDNKVKVEISPKIHASLILFAYNVGKSAFSRSTLLRKLNQGDYNGACEQLHRWNLAGGRVVQGLVNRRQFEYDLCISGIVK